MARRRVRRISQPEYQSQEKEYTDITQWTNLIEEGRAKELLSITRCPCWIQQTGTWNQEILHDSMNSFYREVLKEQS